MTRSLALLAFSSAVMAAQSTTVSLLLPFADPQPLVASVVAVDSAATTYLYGCPPGTPSDSCGFTGSETVTQGPSTWGFTMSYVGDDGGHYTEGGHCKLNSAADAASCSMFYTQTDSAGSVSTTASEGVQTFLSWQIPVTITAGADKLKATPGAAATDGSTAAPTDTAASKPSQTNASSGAASTTLARQTTAAGNGNGNSTRTASTTAGPTSTNAAGFANVQNGLLAGVAALIGGIVML